MTSAASAVAYLSRSLKGPRIGETAASLAVRAREESWNYEAYLAAVLAEEVNSRESHGGENRVRFAHFPQVKTLDEEERHLPGAAGDRQDASLHRLGGAGRPAGIPGAVRYR